MSKSSLLASLVLSAGLSLYAAPSNPVNSPFEDNQILKESDPPYSGMTIRHNGLPPTPPCPPKWNWDHLRRPKSPIPLPRPCCGGVCLCCRCKCRCKPLPKPRPFPDPYGPCILDGSNAPNRR